MNESAGTLNESLSIRKHDESSQLKSEAIILFFYSDHVIKNPHILQQNTWSRFCSVLLFYLYGSILLVFETEKHFNVQPE